MAGVIAPSPSPSRPSDRCPGVLRPHLAADGAMVRIRIPGGQTTGAALDRLGELAQSYGNGLLQLTSRGSVQIRGLPEVLPDLLADGIAAAGFLPSPSHDRVRNIVATPLTGLYGGQRRPSSNDHRAGPGPAGRTGAGRISPAASCSRWTTGVAM